MNTVELIAAVTTAILREELQPETDGVQTTARFLLVMSADQMAAVAHAVLADHFLHASIEMKLPRAYVGDYGLPDDVLTDNAATYFRNANCQKSAFLLATVEHDEEASLSEVTRLGSRELFDKIGFWVRAACNGLGMAPQQQIWWEKALAGLQDLHIASLDRFADYVLRTRHEFLDKGQPILEALGAALPTLRIPRDASYFQGIKERSRTHTSAWKASFTAVQKRRAGLLLKQTSNQLLLTEKELQKAFDKVRNQVPEEDHPVVQAFIAAPNGWNKPAAALAECEWEHISPIFDGLQRVQFDLGRNTREFYNDQEPGLITDEERDYLKRLTGRKTSEDIDEDLAFYEAHRNEIKDDRKLKSAWDKFVYGHPIEATDFMAGLCAAMEPLYNRMPLGLSRRLSIRCESATKSELKGLNVNAGLYFALRYAGLRNLLGMSVTWHVGELFNFPDLVKDWKANGTKLNYSAGRPAHQLKFYVELETTTDQHISQTPPTQIVWRYEPSTVASQLVDDWDRLAKNPFTGCRTSRELSGDKTINLADVNTFMPAHGRDRGSFVPAYKKDKDIALNWRKNLKECVAQQYLPQQSAVELEASFAAFATAYSSAISEFPKKGSGSDALVQQVIAYEKLLNEVVGKAKGDHNRDKLLKPLLEIGVVFIDGGSPAAAVAPWHPMRLAAMWRKANLAHDLIDQILQTQSPEGDTKLFFRDLSQDFIHPLYPEVVCAWTTEGPTLLSVSDTVADYSLHEPPVAGNNETDTNENPAESSIYVLDLVRRYLALHPHERANMSVVLFNCDSARLPQAVVEKIGGIQDDDEDVRCQVLLRNTEAQRLQDVYRSVLTAEATADAYSASEVTQDFMARLRISVIADQAPPPNPQDGCPYDIVFSQDVISRHAQLEWYLENADPSDIRTLLPSRWSRRRPAARDDLKSAVYLCCPVQSPQGWAYLTAVASVFKGDWDGDISARLLPVRQLDFRDGQTSRIFTETHDLGNWVVNFDELLDRRQLINQEVRVIRYKQMATQGRNLIISSRAPLTLLRSMILQRIQALHLELNESDTRQLADRLIDDANDMSGDIVLRAASRGESASELIGIVLSRRILRDDLGSDQLFGWYFLDDYAAWIGQREQQIADLLAIKPEKAPDGKLRITLAVSEAKYVEIGQLLLKRKESQKQLRDTLQRLDDAVFGDPERLDRQSWLARLADLMLDGIRIPAASGINLSEWRRAMREGNCEIELRGVSHVFVPTTDVSDQTEATEVAGTRNAYQEIYGRKALKQLLIAYWKNQTTKDVRRALGFDHLDAAPNWRAPGAGVTAPEPPKHQVHPVQPVSTDNVSTGTSDAQSPIKPYEPVTVATVSPAEPGSSGTAAQVVVSDATWAYDSISQLIRHWDSDGGTSATDQHWLDQISLSTKSALQQLHLQAKPQGASLTPNSALLRFNGSASLTVDLVIKKRSELLTTFGLNIISVRPEPGVVVIAVEREQRQTIDIRSLWARWRPASSSWGNQELLIGVRENDGNLLFLSPAKDHAPHTLIAGSTGSGKSVLMQNIILAIAATNTPEQARIILIDPKQGVDYFAFDGLPHLDGSVIDDQHVASARLENLVAEMNIRYARFKNAKVANLAAYNSIAAPADRLPVIWLIHDEFAEWMLTEEYKDAVSATVQRLSVKARAAGIYLVFAAQRPDANVMPMQLRSNLGNRLILRVDSEGTSEISLGEKGAGAERLLGRGHLLAKLEGESKIIYAQVPYVDLAFAKQVVAATIKVPEPI